MKNKLIIIVVIVVLLAGGYLYNSRTGDQQIGGERDEYGCLGPAGYAWSAEVGACIKDFELSDSQKEAAKKAVEAVGHTEGITIVQVVSDECEGCFMVEVEKGKDRIKVELEGLQVVNKSMAPDDCENIGGETVTTTGGVTCEKGTTNVGDVTGFISPAICCIATELTYEEALDVAKDSECNDKGSLESGFVYNANSKTWWLDMGIDEEYAKDGCNPACVVDEETETAEINWRCTGLIPDVPAEDPEEDI